MNIQGTKFTKATTNRRRSAATSWAALSSSSHSLLVSARHAGAGAAARTRPTLVHAAGSADNITVSLSRETSPSLSLSQVLTRFGDHRVLVVGDVMLDEYLNGQSSRISSEAPVPVLQFTNRRTVLGGA